MVYELRKYNSFNSFRDEDDLGVIAWETDEVLDDDNLRFCGKLITHVFNDSTVNVPNGIEALGYSFLIPYFWGGWCCSVDTVHIPASVTTIEEGAFVNTEVSNIIIDPESTCGIIKENGLAIQQSYVIWQKKFGILRFGVFIKTSLPFLIFFTASSVVLQLVSQKEVDINTIAFTFFIVLFFTALYLYLAAMKTVKQFGENIRERKIQVLLKENEIDEVFKATALI